MAYFRLSCLFIGMGRKSQVDRLGASATIATVFVGAAAFSSLAFAQDATHYVSVNDGGIAEGNFNNDGATGVNSLAIGVDAKAGQRDAVALGNNAGAAGLGGVAIGPNAQATTEGVVAIGDSAGVGVPVTPDNTGAVYLGLGAGLRSNGAWNTFIGPQNVGSESVGSKNVAIGQVAGFALKGDDNTMVGTLAGNNAASDGSAWLGFGAGSDSNGDHNVATGYSAGMGVQGNENVASGTFAGAGTKGDRNLAIGARAGLVWDAATQSVTEGVEANDTMSLGTDAFASGDNAIAIGKGATARGVSSISIGLGNIVTGNNSGAIGDPSTIDAANSYSVGNNNTLGASATNSFVLGNDVNITVDNATALGNATGVTVSSGVALGSNSIASTVLGVGGYDPSTGTVSTQTGATWISTLGAVSVGGNSQTRQITNVAAGSADTDVVNVAQLKLAQTEISTVNDRALKYDWTDTNGDGKVDPGEVSYNKATLNPGGAPTTITNLTEGVINATSSDAVNGSQVFGVSDSVAKHLGADAVVNANGTVTGPTYVMQGGNYKTIYETFAAVDTTIGTINNQIATINSGGAKIKYFTVNSTLPDSQAIGQDSLSAGAGAKSDGDRAISVGRNSEAKENETVAIGTDAKANYEGDVALGAGSSTEKAVGTERITINGKNYTFAGTKPVGTVSVGSEDNERTITNMAAGRIAAESTDAINGSQGYALGQAIETLESGIGKLDKNAVKYDIDDRGSKKNSVTLTGGDPNAPVVLSNVAEGKNPTDAVNVKQLETKATWMIDQSKRYTDTKFTTITNNFEEVNHKIGDLSDQIDGLNGRIDDVRSEARQAAAVGLASSSLRFDDRAGKFSVAVGGGVWRDEHAIAFGAGYTSENQKIRANLRGAHAGGEFGVAGGLSFTLN